MKNKLKKMMDAKNKALEAKRAKIDELTKRSDASEDVQELKNINNEIRSLNSDIDGIVAELEELKEMYGEADEPAGEGEGGEGGTRSAKLKAITGARGAAPEGDEEAEKRAKAFVASGRMNIKNEEARAVLVSSGKIATPTEVDGINEGFNTVSSIVDMVKVTNAQGMGAYKVAYEDTDAEAGATAEGAAYNESDPTFGFVEITPEKVTVISYISDEVQKQTPLDYESKVKAAALKALRKKAANVLTTKALASAINGTVDFAEAKINEKTLRKIALSFGGDENVEGGAVLYLNKLDLTAFGDVRGTNEKKAVYEITPDTNNPNTGIIKDGGLSVKYCINSNITALSTAKKGAAAVKTMMYGEAHAIELALFSDYEVKVSEDYKFGEGLLAIRGSAQIGAGVVKKGGVVIATLTANA